MFLMTFNSLVIPKVAENMEVKKAGKNSPLVGSITPSLYVSPLSIPYSDAIRIVRSIWHWGMDSKNGSATNRFDLEFAFAFFVSIQHKRYGCFFFYMLIVN